MLKKAQQTMSRDDFLAQATRMISSPKKRIAEPLRSVLFDETKLLKRNNWFFDVHAHSFTIDHIPKDFIKILNWVSNKHKANILQWVDRKFGALAGLDDPKKVIDNLVSLYDQFFVESKVSPHLFIVNLSMDMERGISGAPTFNFKSQLEQLLKFNQEHSPVMKSGRKYDYKTTILPFLAIDPNNPDAYKYFLSGFIKDFNQTGIKALDKKNPFIGIKLYPTLGYTPLDPVLLDIYDICEKNSIPITTHCGGLRTRTNNRKVEIGRRSIVSGQVIDSVEVIRLNSKQAFKNVFVDPLHWDQVLQQFPRLKLNLAHFGDNLEWKKFHANPKDPSSHVFKTLKMIERYENVYADISYSYFDEDNRRVISAMMQEDRYRHKIMNGSDFFLTEIEKYTTKNYMEKLQDVLKLDPEGYHLLTAVNPWKFLCS